MTHPLTPRAKVLLKPCPFCGGEAEMFSMSDRIGVRCADVMCAGSHRLPSAGEDSVALWNRRTALASGSGDHAELIERVREVAGDCLDAKDGGIILGGTVAREHGADLEALLAEIAALRAKRDGMVEEVSRSQARLHAATEAERKLAEAVGLLTRWLNARGETSGPGTVETLTSTFLSKEAERG